jgi:hypothetical protein
LWICSPAATADAQSQRLYAISGTTVAELDTEPSHFAAVLRSWTLPRHLTGHAVSVGAGRYLVVPHPGTTTMSVFDTVTGALSTASVPTTFAWLEFIAADSDTGELLFKGGSQLPATGLVSWNPLTGSATSIDVPGSCPTAWAYARGTRTVFVVQRSECGPAGMSWVDSVDMTTGQIRPRLFDVPTGGYQAITVNAAGTRLWLKSHGAAVDSPSGIGVFDVISGALFAINGTASPRLDSALWLDEARNVLLAVGPAGIAGLDGSTLRALGATDAPAYRRPTAPLPTGYGPTFGYQVLTDPKASSILVYEWSGASLSYHGGPCLQSALVAFDNNTGRRLAERDLATLAGAPVCGASFALATAPAAPVDLQAMVDGHRVTLSWQAPAGATHYELEVGSVPGARDLGVFIPDGNPFTVADVPSGAYHVRLRALNYSGKGAFTASRTIVVP